MNKAIKIISWILGILGIALGAWCLAKGEAGNEAPVDAILRYAYALLIATVVILLGLSVFMGAKNNPKSLVKGLILLVAAAVLVGIVYALASGAPALNVKEQPEGNWLKITDTFLTLVAVLGIGAVASIVFAVIRNAFTK